MINCRKRTINNTVAIDAGVAGGGERKPVCYTKKVLDSFATSNAIASCKKSAQDKIDTLTTQIQEYADKLLELENYKTEIDEKIASAESAVNSMNDAQDILNSANICFDLNVGCQSCLDKISTSLNNMKTKCDTEMDEIKLKKEQAETDLKTAETDLSSCSSIKKYTTITVCDR